MAGGIPSYDINPDITPSVETGSGAPSSTPQKVGDLYVDTENGNLYFASGTSGSGDWTELSNAA